MKTTLSILCASAFICAAGMAPPQTDFPTGEPIQVYCDVTNFKEPTDLYVQPRIKVLNGVNKPYGVCTVSNSYQTYSVNVRPIFDAQGSVEGYEGDYRQPWKPPVRIFTMKWATDDPPIVSYDGIHYTNFPVIIKNAIITYTNQ